MRDSIALPPLGNSDFYLFPGSPPLGNPLFRTFPGDHVGESMESTIYDFNALPFAVTLIFNPASSQTSGTP